MQNKILKLSFIVSLILMNSFANEVKDLKSDKVVVSASGFEEEADSTIRNVMVIEGDELHRRSYTSLEQALERIALVSFVDNGLGTSIDMRGQGDKANVAVKLMVDGRSVNVLDNSHGVTPLNSINIDDVERIEIIPGGGSVLYGNGTRGGVINVITKKKKEDSFGLGVRGNIFEDSGAGGFLNANGAKKFNDNFSFSFDINGFNKDGYQDGYNEKGFYVNTKSYVDFSEVASLIIAYNYFESKNTSTGYLTKAQIEADPTQAGSDNVIAKTNRPELSLDFNYILSDEWQFDLEAFWQNQTIKYLKSNSPYAGTLDGLNQDGSSFEDMLTGVNLKTKYDYLDNSYLVFGYEFLSHNAKRFSRQNYAIAIFEHNMTTNMDMDKLTHSIFLLDLHEFNDIFSLSGGARYEYATYKTDRSYRNQMTYVIPTIPSVDTTTPYSMEDKDTSNFAIEITPSFKYSDTGSIYLKYERGYVSPTPAQFITRGTSTGASTDLCGGAAYCSSDLDSETFNTFEIGVKDFWWDFHAWNVTLFYTQSKDEISYIGDPHNTGGAYWKYYNIDETRRYGVELHMSQSLLNDSLYFKEGLSYIDAEISKGINDGLRIPYVSTIKASASAEYSFNKFVNAFIDLSYLSRAKDGGNTDADTGKITYSNWIKERFITDIGAQYRYKNLLVMAGIRNLFDEEYYTYQNAVSDNYTPGQGRNYYLELKYDF
ncbi:TonB-dependent receptor [Campylobacter sp. LR185c]|uniref:TonB-dependent receptor n=1 Tax=Campylobacter sp. LR185c TaxID=2014525 RepID=UPI00123826D4|nr:TonB-dependent receptor [Campylobacter sp. LR185c]KAA8604834.1 TonB-dependent receptor [Campylobacter sp. LR185c]